MTLLALAALTLAVFAAVPAVVPACARRGASPRLLAAAYLVSLIGLALLPAGWLAYAGLGLAGLLGWSPAIAADCGLVLHAGWWGLLGGGLALVALLPLVRQALRVLAAARRTELAGSALAAADRRPLRGGGVVWVLPASEPAACACGLRRPRAVVTRGLLALLDPEEAQAVVEHEGAHVRLGHPRLLLLGAAIARAYRFLPPVRRAWAGLRRALEAAADDEAARLVGTTPLLTALARVGLAQAATRGSGARFADLEDLRYRLERLRNPRPPGYRASALATVVGTAVGTGLAGALAWSACVLISGSTHLADLLLCLGALAVVGARPMWSRPTTPPSAASGA